MKHRIRMLLFAGLGLGLSVGCSTPGDERASDRDVARSSSDETLRSSSDLMETGVMTHATGTFDVRLEPRSSDGGAEGTPLGRMSIEKRYHGDLEGTATGEMLTAMTPTDGSAGYVAVERVSGSLHGRAGTFVLQHSGTMTRGEPRLAITVVPDSGTGELQGLTGSMLIDVTDGQHSYELEYSLR